MSIPAISSTASAAVAANASGAARALPAAPQGAGTVSATTDKPQVAPGRDDVVEAVKTLNKFVDLAAQGIEFSVDEALGKTIVKVVDTETKTVLRQIPSEEALSIARSLDKMQGLLIRQKA